MNCPKCGRFMKLRVHYTNEHDDSWEEHWTCATRHPTPEQKARAEKLVAEAREENERRLIQEWRELFIAMSLTRENRS